MAATLTQGSLKALLWDVDGTLAETELQGHRVAFNRAFAERGMPWRWDPPTYLELLAISGGRERLRAFLAGQGHDPSEEEVEALQRSKQRHYRSLVERGEVRLRPGVRRLIAETAAAGIRQAIVTTSGRTAVSALLQSQLPDLAAELPLWICGEDVPRKKPDPAAHALALERLGLEPWQAVAIEDSGNGLAAARAAGLRCLVTLSAPAANEPAAAFAMATAVVDGLGEEEAPSAVLQGPACPAGRITLSYLQQLTLQP